MTVKKYRYSMHIAQIVSGCIYAYLNRGGGGARERQSYMFVTFILTRYDIVQFRFNERAYLMAGKNLSLPTHEKKKIEYLL